MKYRKKSFTSRDVLEAALERIRYLHESFDEISVSFSGGKDSTACLQLTIKVAKELGRLPVRAIFFDEEVIHPTTIEYVDRVRRSKGVNLEWYCLPVKHRNACSNDEPFWTCWDPSKRALWVREMPTCGIQEHSVFKSGMSFQEFCPLIAGKNGCVIQGLRAQESLRRTRIMLGKKNDNYIARFGGKASAFPIYDWSSEDVWKLVRELGCDYNQTYDIFNRTRFHNRLLTQRVCPPFGEEPLRGLWVYAECWPELWHKMLARVPGVATAWRYSNTALYSNTSKPESMTWQEYCRLLIGNYTEANLKHLVQAAVDAAVKEHSHKTDDPIHDSETHPLSGCSWKYICKIAIKGDLKGRQKGNLIAAANAEQRKRSITPEQAFATYGKKAANR